MFKIIFCTMNILIYAVPITYTFIYANRKD